MPNQYDTEFVKDLFNKMSKSYERVNYITSFGFSLRWRRQFLNELSSSKEKVRVLDLMTGMGETWKPIKKRYPNCRFDALDFSEGMLNYARKKNEKRFDNTVQIINQNALHSNLNSSKYDYIFCTFGLKTFNSEQIYQLANEIKRLLKPGGEFSLIEVSQPKNKLLRIFYKIHLKHIVPICGKILLGNPKEYKMLWRYTQDFENAKKTHLIFSSIGLNTQYVSYFGDCASGITGYKPNPKL